MLLFGWIVFIIMLVQHAFWNTPVCMRQHMHPVPCSLSWLNPMRLPSARFEFGACYHFMQSWQCTDCSYMQAAAPFAKTEPEKQPAAAPDAADAKKRKRLKRTIEDSPEKEQKVVIWR